MNVVKAEVIFFGKDVHVYFLFLIRRSRSIPDPRSAHVVRNIYFSSPPWGFLKLRKKSDLRISCSGPPYFLLSPRFNGEGASVKLFEEAMPRFLPRNRPVRFDPRSPRQSLAVHARRKLTREGYFKSIKGVGPSGKRDMFFSDLALAGLNCRLLFNF